MNKKLTFLEWSLNMRSDKTVQPHEAFYKGLEMCSPKPDVLFLVETVKGNEFEVEGYTFIVESDNPYGNSTRLAIRNELLENGEIQVLRTCGQIPDTSFEEAPHYAQADVLVNGRLLNLIATRVLINFGKDTVEEYRQRRKQYELLVKHVSALENPVVMGDFNHGRILGFGKETPHMIRLIFEECAQVQGDYFYQSIKNDLRERNLRIHTPDFLISCGPKVVNGVVQARELPSWNYKIDHLIMKAESDAVEVDDIIYDWGHLEWAVKRGATQDILKRKGFPDHAMLMAKVIVKGQEESEAE